uniref:Zasp-like motif domain-containing protein n=1 Tax=Nyssomyia neivai TaxID=330878 RepID=A0A1L8DCI6_9DIPT
MAQRTLVHKQFNSPIGLYSNRNVQETLDRELRQLSNGAVGIDFENNPAATKPGNLANSAVLRMLEEEEEEQRRAGNNEGLRRVAWPPPSDVSVHPSQVPLQVNNQQPQYQAPASAPTATPYQDGAAYGAQQAVPPNQYQTQSYQTTTSYQKTSTESQEQQQYYQPGIRQQSPGIITLRTELPVSQTPAPVYASQPPVFSFKGGVNMRGDQKWPPQEYKEQAAEENAARLRLAAGPACRPRRIAKDYTAFFAKNALSHNYPGYRVPPGTQHINGQSMM